MATIHLGGESTFHTHGQLEADCSRTQFWAEIQSMEKFLTDMFGDSKQPVSPDLRLR